jgi:hypothetical protein
MDDALRIFIIFFGDIVYGNGKRQCPYNMPFGQRNLFSVSIFIQKWVKAGSILIC